MNKIKRENFYNLVKSIPIGKITTYGKLAKITDVNSPRYVGYLLHHNPDPKKIPCHRVVNSKGELAKNFAFGGIKGQAEKLMSENVIIKSDRVDLKKYMWR